MNSSVYMITYEGQTESPYVMTTPSLSAAMEEVERLEQEYPNRVWHLEEKDVS